MSLVLQATLQGQLNEETNLQLPGELQQQIDFYYQKDLMDMSDLQTQRLLYIRDFLQKYYDGLLSLQRKIDLKANEIVVGLQRGRSPDIAQLKEMFQQLLNDQRIKKP